MRAGRTNCGGSSPSEKDPPANHRRGVCLNCTQFAVHGACEHCYAALHVTELASFDSRRLHQACFKCCGLKLHNNESAFAKMADDACEPTHAEWAANLQWPEILEELRRRYCSRNFATLHLTLRDTRVSKPSDWVSQLSSTVSSSLPYDLGMAVVESCPSPRLYVDGFFLPWVKKHCLFGVYWDLYCPAV